jgi:hypothetical protein
MEYERDTAATGEMFADRYFASLCYLSFDKATPDLCSSFAND